MKQGVTGTPFRRNIMDIFEKLRDKLGCMYISDIKFGERKDKAIDLLKKMQVDGSQKADICNYLGIGAIL
jgi:hypothetical protein